MTNILLIPVIHAAKVNIQIRFQKDSVSLSQTYSLTNREYMHPVKGYLRDCLNFVAVHSILSSRKLPKFHWKNIVL